MWAEIYGNACVRTIQSLFAGEPGNCLAWRWSVVHSTYNFITESACIEKILLQFCWFCALLIKPCSELSKSGVPHVVSSIMKV
jgi:hypothetical protein